MKKIKVLILLANPQNTFPLRLQREREIIEEAISRSKHKNKFKLTFIEASTIHDLRQALLDADFQIIHFSAHGTGSGLILENNAGEPHQIPQEALAELLADYKTIECVVLNACYSVSQASFISPQTAHTIAMEDRLDDEAALEFSRGFYDAVGAGKNYGLAYRQGCINVKLLHPNALFPSVFLTNDDSMREISLIDKTQPSVTANASGSSEPENDAPSQLKVGIPPLPDIFLGREDDLGILKERLGLIKGARDTGPVQVLSAFRESRGNKSSVTALRGFPGIGKTATATVLAEDREILQAFPDGILWASLGQTPNAIYTIGKWGEHFGTDEIYRAPTLKEAVERLSDLLKKKRLLMIIDDVWQAEDAVPFKQACGNDCSLLITTRAPQVTSELSILPEAVHNLPGLTEKTSLELLEILAPTVVPAYPKDCLEIVRILECVPLALHVAGRLLNEESREIWGVTELLKSLRKGKAIIEAKAPADLMDLEKQTIPSVAALLRKSVDTLDPKTQMYFAFLAPFAEKPATFDLEALKASWRVEDPRPIVRRLTSRGLLEPIGDRYQMHSLLVALADALLEEL